MNEKNSPELKIKKLKLICGVFCAIIIIFGGFILLGVCNC